MFAYVRFNFKATLLSDEKREQLVTVLMNAQPAVIFQPKVTLPMRIKNRQTSVMRTVVWDPLRHGVELLACDVCLRPNARLFWGHNGHLACAGCLAPRCVDCKRVFCRNCAAEMTACVVCDRPVRQKSLTRCPECGRGTCREHAGLCHAAEGQPQRRLPSAIPPEMRPPPRLWRPLRRLAPGRPGLSRRRRRIWRYGCPWKSKKAKRVSWPPW